jgi:hypothetical protein
MTKAGYNAISATAAEAFTKCVDALVMKGLDVPNLGAVGASLASDTAANATTNLNQRDNGIV